MAHDLLLKHNSHNWSRDLDDVAPVQDTPKRAAVVDKKTKTQTAKLAAVKAAADRGDKKAKKKWGKICKKVEKIRKAAAAGNPDASRQLAKIEATGLFTLTTSSGAFVGADDDVYETLQKKLWQNPYPIAIDRKDAESAPADETVRGIPFKQFLSAGIKTGKIKLTDKGSRIFFIGKRGVVASQKPTSSSGAHVNDDKLTEILTSGAFIGRDEILGKDEILGHSEFIGEEELALAREGGACERAALARRSSRR